MPGISDPVYEYEGVHLRVVGSGLPTCVRLLDTITLTATHVVSPTAQAVNTTQVQLLPDRDTCSVVDVGVSQVASHPAIAAGGRVTFTVIITNYETVAATAVVTDTLTPPSALADVSLPSGCSRSGGQVSCSAVQLGAGASRTLVLGVRTRLSFGGTLSSQAWAEPAEAGDDRPYDNVTGPVEVAVAGPPGRLNLPLLPKVRGR